MKTSAPLSKKVPNSAAWRRVLLAFWLGLAAGAVPLAPGLRLGGWRLLAVFCSGTAAIAWLRAEVRLYKTYVLGRLGGGIEKQAPVGRPSRAR